jgi:hypothetical protein
LIASQQQCMYRFSSKLGVWNSRKAPQVVAVEPWANDNTLLPDEKLEIIAFGNTAVPWFNVVEWDHAGVLRGHSRLQGHAGRSRVGVWPQSPTARIDRWAELSTAKSRISRESCSTRLAGLISVSAIES